MIFVQKNKNLQIFIYIGKLNYIFKLKKMLKIILELLEEWKEEKLMDQFWDQWELNWIKKLGYKVIYFKIFFASIIKKNYYSFEDYAVSKIGRRQIENNWQWKAWI